MKNVKQIMTDRNRVICTADAVNHENSPAWTKPDSELLEQFAMTGTLGNSFYAGAKENTENAVELLERCDASAIASAIVKGRNEGFIRTFPLLGLVFLSKKDPEQFKAVFSQVVKTGNDLGDFIDLCKSMRGLGRSVKSAISAWITYNTSDYYAQKYRRQIADAVRLVRFKGDSDPIFGYVLAGYGDRVKGWSAAKEQAAYEKYPNLKAHRDFIAAIEAGENASALSILKEHKLDVDSLTACYDKFDAAIWREIARLSPVMRFMKYLDKFDRAGVFSRDIKLAKEKMSVANFQAAKVFPFRLYTAYANISNPAVKNHLAAVLDEYTAAYDWSTFNAYSWAVCPDVSGSMSGVCSGSLTFSDIAGMFTGFFAKGLKDCRIIPWSDRVFQWDVPRNDSIITHIRELKHLDGGTDMSCALRAMIARNIRRDFLVFITDTEEYGRRYRIGSGWIDAWIEYRKRVNPRARAFILRADSYTTNPFPEKEAKKYDIYPIYGWNDNVIKYMQYIVKNSCRQGE